MIRLVAALTACTLFLPALVRADAVLGPAVLGRRYVVKRTPLWIGYQNSFRATEQDFSGEGLSLAKLHEAIETHKIASVNGLLKYFSKTGDQRHQELLQSMVLVYASESLQGVTATKKHPRVILHKDRLFLGLAGDPGRRHSNAPIDVEKRNLYNQLEVIEYDAQAGKFVFERIHFPGRRGKGRVVYDRDDTRCRDCHGRVTPRPIWGTYDLWPGTYFGHNKTSEAEQKAFADFLEAVNENTHDRALDRYRFLKFRRPEEQNYLGRGPLAMINNTGFFIHLQYANFFRVMKELQEKANYRDYKYALLAAFYHCPDIENFVPPQVREKHAKKIGMTYAALERETSDNVRDEYEGRIRRINELEPGRAFRASDFELKEPSYANPDIVAKLRWLVEGQGVDMRHWSLSREAGKDTYSYAFGVARSAYFTVYMLARDYLLPDIRPEADEGTQKALDMINDTIWEERAPDVRARTEKACGWLKEKSLGQFSE